MGKYGNEELISKFKAIHGDKYIYANDVSDNRDENGKIMVTCPRHGEFRINLSKHLNGQGCKQCYQEKRQNKQARFVYKAALKHNGKYKYDKVEYKDPYTNVCIVCPKHGDFSQTPSTHLMGCGCKECMKEKFAIDQDVFIDRIRGIFGDKYDLSKIVYKNNREKVTLSCKVHGEFTKTPSGLYRGQGCPKCKVSKLENEIMLFLGENGIDYIYQCNNAKFKWLGLQSLDFYLPEYNLAIECQGEQHFRCGGNIFTEEKLIRTKDSDKRKLNKCKEHGIRILYYSNLGIEYPYEVFEDKGKLLEEIKNGGD